MHFVIPGLTRNPVLFWIPAFAGMARSVVLNDAVYKRAFHIFSIEEGPWTENTYSFGSFALNFHYHNIHRKECLRLVIQVISA
jgi:hypothetical protein